VYVRVCVCLCVCLCTRKGGLEWRVELGIQGGRRAGLLRSRRVNAASPSSTIRLSEQICSLAVKDRLLDAGAVERVSDELEQMPQLVLARTPLRKVS
jgi:hypothetical protein